MDHIYSLYQLALKRSATMNQSLTNWQIVPLKISIIHQLGLDRIISQNFHTGWRRGPGPTWTQSLKKDQFYFALFTKHIVMLLWIIDDDRSIYFQKSVAILKLFHFLFNCFAGILKKTFLHMPVEYNRTNQYCLRKFSLVFFCF